MSVSRVLVILALALAVAGVGYAWYPPFRLFTWVAAGRSPDCPLPQALQSERNEEMERESNERIIKDSKLISIDAGGLELWQTPQGRFWIPNGSRNRLPFFLAAQERKVFGDGDASPRVNDVAIDWGANIGVTLSEELEAGVEKVIAVERSREDIECLRRNLSNEIALGRVVLFPADEGATIDSVAAELKLSKVDSIRVDDAGSEPKVIRGAGGTILRFHPRITVTTYHRSSNPKLIEETVRRMRPAYQVRCGPCFELKEAHSIRPDALYFR